MNWKEVLSIVLRKCKWRIIIAAIILAAPLILGWIAAAKPLEILPLDSSSGSSDSPRGFPDPDIDPL